MRQKAFALIFAFGIIVTAGYTEAQKMDFFIPVKESKQEEQDQSAAAQSTASQAKVVQSDNQNQNQTQSQTQTQNQSENQNQVQTQNQTQNEKIIINGVPHIQQMPELARGCEVTSLAMLLQYAGVSIDKMTLAKQIKKVPFRDQNGVRGNPNDGFVGDMYSFSKSGYGVYHSPIAELAKQYLPSRIVDLTGQSIDAVYNMVKTGSPVWVITNSRFAPLAESEFANWNTNSGKVQITYREHSVVIVGYDINTFI